MKKKQLSWLVCLVLMMGMMVWGKMNVEAAEKTITWDESVLQKISIGIGDIPGIETSGTSYANNGITATWSDGRGVFYWGESPVREEEGAHILSAGPVCLNFTSSVGTIKDIKIKCWGYLGIDETSTAFTDMNVTGWTFNGMTDPRTAPSSVCTITYNGSSAESVDFKITENIEMMVLYISEITFTVESSVDVTGVSLNKSSTTLAVGGTETLSATVAPTDATDSTVTWSSSDESVATVSNGVVTGVKAGTATITATATNGTADTSDDQSATCTVTVKAEEAVPYEKVEIKPGKIQDITGSSSATAESNPYSAKIKNSDLKTLFNITDAEEALGVNVWVDVQKNSTISDTDKGKMTNSLGEYTEGQILEICLYKKVGSNATELLTNSNGKVELTIIIPENLRKSGREYMLVKLHNGTATTITGALNESTYVFSFETDEFSPYMIAYKDVAKATSSSSSTASSTSTTTTTKTTASKAPKTQDRLPVMWYALLAIAGGLMFVGKRARK